MASEEKLDAKFRDVTNELQKFLGRESVKEPDSVNTDTLAQNFSITAGIAQASQSTKWLRPDDEPQRSTAMLTQVHTSPTNKSGRDAGVRRFYLPLHNAARQTVGQSAMTPSQPLGSSLQSSIVDTRWTAAGQSGYRPSQSLQSNIVHTRWAASEEVESVGPHADDQVQHWLDQSQQWRGNMESSLGYGSESNAPAHAGRAIPYNPDPLGNPSSLSLITINIVDHSPNLFGVCDGKLKPLIQCTLPRVAMQVQSLASELQDKKKEVLERWWRLHASGCMRSIRGGKQGREDSAAKGRQIIDLTACSACLEKKTPCVIVGKIDLTQPWRLIILPIAGAEAKGFEPNDEDYWLSP